MMPESGSRTLLSFLIFLHMFAIGVGTFSTYNWSHLERALRDVPPIRPYLQLVGMDVPFVALYSLTFGEEFDRDFSFTVVEVDPKKKPEDLGTVQLPGPDTRPLERARRYDRLARKVAQFGAPDQQDEAAQALIAMAVGKYELKKHGWDRCRVRCIGRRIPLMQHARSLDPAERDISSPMYFEKIYEAEVWITKRGDFQMQKVEAASDTAPAAAPQSTK
jgi:hypothetical protein